MKAFAVKVGRNNTLLSQRLRMTRPGAQDFDECARMWEDGDTTKFMGGKPFSREQVWSRLLRHVGHWDVLGFGFWTLRERTTGTYVGEAGFYHLKRDLEPSLDDCPEVGWVLAPWARGKGFAREAVSTILSWSDRNFEIPRTVCLIDPRNAPSLRVAEARGYTLATKADYQGSEILMLERTRAASRPSQT